jgi:hypothetical protein
MRWSLLLALLVQVSTPAAGAGQTWLACTAWGTSHTGHYTFRVATAPCAVYWRELDRDLEIASCVPPVIVAIKPFAVSTGWELHFNLATGDFEDFTPAWSDRGRCVPVGDESTRH